MKSYRIWASHIRWASLCPHAWKIITGGAAPFTPSTPESVEELRKEHDRLLETILKPLTPGNSYTSPDGIKYRIVVQAYDLKGKTIGEDLLSTTYTIKLDENRIYEIHAKPDIYILLTHENPVLPIDDKKNAIRRIPPGAVNIIVEATLRPETHITREWIQALSIPYYLRNLQPTVFILVTRDTVKARVLRPKDSIMLARFLARGPHGRRPTLSLCRNCDLRSQCPSPLT